MELMTYVYLVGIGIAFLVVGWILGLISFTEKFKVIPTVIGWLIIGGTLVAGIFQLYGKYKNKIPSIPSASTSTSTGTGVVASTSTGSTSVAIPLPATVAPAAPQTAGEIIASMIQKGYHIEGVPVLVSATTPDTIYVDVAAFDSGTKQFVATGHIRLKQKGGTAVWECGHATVAVETDTTSSKAFRALPSDWYEVLPGHGNRESTITILSLF